MKTGISVVEAQQIVLDACPVLGCETVASVDAQGRVLAAPVVSGRTLPPADCSAMDGYALRAGDLTGASESNPVALSVAYEVAAGGDPSVVSDIYSIGAVLYECLAGEPPFKGTDDKETLALLARAPVRPVSEKRDALPKGLENLVETLLLKDPDKRLLSAAQMEVALRSYLRETHPVYTESHLAKTIGSYFRPTDFMDPTPRESLLKELADA